MLRIIAATVVGCLLVSGCQTLHPEPVSDAGPVSTNRPPEEPRFLALDGSVGRVVQVHGRLRFVVLDYALYQLPAQGERLVVERDGAAVGELRVNGPTRGTTVSADLISGEVRPGDLARPRP